MLRRGQRERQCFEVARNGIDPSIGDLTRRYKMICELGQAVTSEMNLEALFDLIMQQTAAIVSSELASVFLYDAVGEHLLSRASIDLKPNAACISPRNGIAGWVFRTKSALISNDPYNDPRFLPDVDKKTGRRTRNILCTPLINREKHCIGTLQALNKRSGDFDADDLDLLTAASYYVTIALENARLYEELKALDMAKQRAIDHLSHEIKTPLAVIACVLRQVSVKAAQGDLAHLEKILLRGERSVKRLKALQEQIDDILQCHVADAGPCHDVSRAALNLLDEIFEEQAERYPEVQHVLAERLASFRGKDDFAGECIHVATFIKGACERALAAMGSREVRLIQRLNEEAVIHTDWNVLDKVCSGLLKNAIENTPDEGAIEVAVETSGDETRITFTDFGVGIAAEDQKMIFGGFFHTQPTALYSSKRPYDFNAGGTGADLLRMKSFANRLGFTVEFVSRRCSFLSRERNLCPGRISRCPFIDKASACRSNGGSTFVVRFPSQPDA
ncbi:MAG: GAF domain-containing protein [Desulfobacterales bacterium]